MKRPFGRGPTIPLRGRTRSPGFLATYVRPGILQVGRCLVKIDAPESPRHWAFWYNFNDKKLSPTEMVEFFLKMILKELVCFSQFIFFVWQWFCFNENFFLLPKQFLMIWYLFFSNNYGEATIYFSTIFEGFIFRFHDYERRIFSLMTFPKHHQGSLNGTQFWGGSNNANVWWFCGISRKKVVHEVWFGVIFHDPWSWTSDQIIFATSHDGNPQKVA